MCGIYITILYYDFQFKSKAFEYYAVWKKSKREYPEEKRTHVRIHAPGYVHPNDVTIVNDWNINVVCMLWVETNARRRDRRILGKNGVNAGERGTEEWHTTNTHSVYTKLEIHTDKCTYA